MGAVYFLRQKTLKPVKIGFTKEKKPLRRINSYKTYFPYGLDFIGYIEFEDVFEAIRFEKECQEYFRLLRINKEWFDINEQQINDFVKKKKYVLINTYAKERDVKQKEIISLFENEKKKPKKIAFIKGVSIQYVYKVLNIKKQLKTNPNHQKILEAYKEIKDVKVVSEKLNISIQYIYRILRKYKQ